MRSIFSFPSRLGSEGKVLHSKLHQPACGFTFTLLGAPVVDGGEVGNLGALAWLIV